MTDRATPAGERERKVRCARCRHPEALRSEATDGRPAYTCTKCGHHWTNGYPASKRRTAWRGA